MKSSTLRRWLIRDPIEERGGMNLYVFCKNNSLANLDSDGCAYFAVRRLSGMPAIVKWSSILCPFDSLFGGQKSRLVDSLADLLNVEILHEHLFFEDGRNVGWGNDEAGSGAGEKLIDEDIAGYTKRDGGYNDCVMQKAVDQVPVNHYQLLWFGARTKCNCQDYADKLRKKYGELLKDRKVRCECGLK